VTGQSVRRKVQDEGHIALCLTLEDLGVAGGQKLEGHFGWLVFVDDKMDSRGSGGLVKRSTQKVYQSGQNSTDPAAP